MIKLDFPAPGPKIKSTGSAEQIFCTIRKRWVLLTPEEWVRQNFILYMLKVLKIPASLISVEKQISIAGMLRRYDIVAYNKNMQISIVVECKEMGVPLSEKTILQMLHYNQALHAQYLVITNGSYCAAFDNTSGKFENLSAFPSAM